MNSIVLFTVLLSIYICNVNTLHLPSYIKACKKDDPNFKKCAIDSANAAISSVVKGDKTYKVIPTNPAKIPKIDLDGGPNLKLYFTDLVATGAEQLKIEDVDFDFDKHTGLFIGSTPKFAIESHYKADGKILSFPLNGEGNCRIEFDNLKIHYTFEFNPHKKDDGIEYLTITNTNVKMDVTKAMFNFENIVNSDLSKQINEALNDSWEEVVKEIGVGVEKALQSIIDVIANGYISNVPYNEVLL